MDGIGRVESGTETESDSGDKAEAQYDKGFSIWSHGWNTYSVCLG